MSSINIEEFFAEVADWEAQRAHPEMMTFKKGDLKSIEITTDASPAIRLLYDAPHLSLVLNQEQGDESAPVFSPPSVDYQSISR